ncbi:MAG: agmatine deiminase family protein, partial [Gammaproteobacteria bacterium]|nr:agmatine deiminase family protein [Gammaproteobacteria bacterium]
MSLFSEPETRPILPAEWSPQNAIMLTWPHAQTDWRLNLAEAESVFIEIAHAISAREQLIISCCDEPHKKSVLKKLKARGIPCKQVSIFIHPSNDSWTRDHGPITVIENGRAHLLDFEFNGWGGKYPAQKDNQLNRALYQ